MDEEDITSLSRNTEQSSVVEEHLIGRIKEMEDQNNYLREELDRFHEYLATKERFENIFISVEKFLVVKGIPSINIALDITRGMKPMMKEQPLKFQKEK